MKRLILLIPILILFNTTNAQIKDFSWGGKFGINWSTFTGADAKDLDFEVKTGVLVGAYFRHNLSGNLFIQPSILYSNKGASRRASSGDQILDVFLNIDYIEIPLMFKYFFSDPDASLKPNLFLGPVGAIKLSSTIEIDIEGVDTGTFFGNIKSSDVGLVFGGGLEFKVSSQHMFLELRFVRSLSSFDDSGNNLDLKNSTFSLVTGFTIN